MSKKKVSPTEYVVLEGMLDVMGTHRLVATLGQICRDKAAKLRKRKDWENHEDEAQDWVAAAIELENFDKN